MSIRALATAAILLTSVSCATITHEKHTAALVELAAVKAQLSICAPYYQMVANQVMAPKPQPRPKPVAKPEAKEQQPEEPAENQTE